MATSINQVKEKTTVKTENSPSFEKDSYGKDRLVYQNEGWNYLDWKGYSVHFIGPVASETASKYDPNEPIFVLLHGYGASAYHWRYNIPELAKIGKVYALDFLGFGWSQKAPEDYSNLKLWPDEVKNFVQEVVGEDKQVILVGNSMGGAVSLSTAGYYPEIVKAVILLNAAGRFADEINSNSNNNNNSSNKGGVSSVSATTMPRFSGLASGIGDILQRIITWFVFWQSKQPARIEQVLRNVYINTQNVDDELVKSIVRPTNDPGAADVFGRVFKFNSGETMDDKLGRLRCPLLLVWGVQDPWMGPQKADKIVAAYPSTQVVRLQSGHCPHDETPDQVNQAISDWVLNLKDNQAIQQWMSTKA